MRADDLGARVRRGAGSKAAAVRVMGAILLALLEFNYFLPVGTFAIVSRPAETLVHSLVVLSPIFCAGLLFGSRNKRSDDVPVDYGANLLGAMVGGVAEYLSLLLESHSAASELSATSTAKPTSAMSTTSVGGAYGNV